MQQQEEINLRLQNFRAWLDTKPDHNMPERDQDLLCYVYEQACQKCPLLEFVSAQWGTDVAIAYWLREFTREEEQKLSNLLREE